MLDSELVGSAFLVLICLFFFVFLNCLFVLLVFIENNRETVCCCCSSSFHYWAQGTEKDIQVRSLKLDG